MYRLYTENNYTDQDDNYGASFQTIIIIVLYVHQRRSTHFKYNAHIHALTLKLASAPTNDRCMASIADK